MKKVVSLFLILAMMLAASVVPCFAVDESEFDITHTGSGFARLNAYLGEASSLDLADLADQYVITEINAEAFAYNETLESIVFTTGLERIGKAAFAVCDSLTSVALPDTLTTIEANAFAECTSLREITIPATVTYIGAGVFSYTSPELVINVYAGSEAEVYCAQNDLNYNTIDAECTHDFSGVTCTAIETCTLEGNYPAKCVKCGRIGEDDLVPALGHDWSEFILEDDERIRTCQRCSQRAIGFTDTMNAASLGFRDLANGKWYSDAMTYCFENLLLAGTSADTIAPHDDLSRSMTVTILAKAAGVTLTEPDIAPFDDVATGKWYTASVAWAAENEIVSGYSESVFGPRDAVTREQLALILYKFAVMLGCETDTIDLTALDDFSDKDTTHSWAYSALCWAKGAGLITGTTANTISPRGTCTRAQAAVMLRQFIDTFMPNPAPAYERVVVISVDGAGAYWSKINAKNVNSIFTAYTTKAQPATLSCIQNFASMLHGVESDIHGITAIDAATPRLSNRIGYPSFMSLVRDRYEDAELAAFCSWAELPHSIIEDGIGLYADYASDDVRMTEDIIVPYIENNDPKVMFVTYRNVMFATPEGGYGGDYHLRQLGLTDNCIGAIYNKYVELGRAENTLFILTSDHGGEAGSTNVVMGSPTSTDIFV